MKKIFFASIFVCVLFLTGCTSYTEKSVVKDLNKKYKKISGYQIEGSMEIYNGDNTYKYNVTSSYEKDRYRVSLINKNNNHEQIILKNDDGVYVLTPSLNKSFKFQSDWPNNNSQVYLPKSILKDINKDKKLNLTKKGNNYILNNKISFSNNKKLDNQKIYMDKNLQIKKIEVFDSNGNIQIKMNYKTFDTNATFNNKYFSVAENMKSTEESSLTTNDEEETTKEDNNSETTSLLDETIYPMYLPDGTYLSTEETVSKEEGERVILTFAGESPFILVEENAKRSTSNEVIPVYGEPTFLIDSVGAMSDSSVNFISNGVEYYIASESLSMEDMINVVESINSVAIMK